MEGSQTGARAVRTLTARPRSPAVPPRRIARLVLFAAVAVVLGLVLSDVLGLRATETGVVSPRGYVPYSHGDHTHYVPNGGIPDGMTASDFPTSPPPDGMTVSPDGQIVPAE